MYSIDRGSDGGDHGDGGDSDGGTPGVPHPALCSSHSGGGGDSL